MYREVEKREDDFHYIISIKGNVKYHKDYNCEALYRGFRNFFVPEPIARLENSDPEKHKRLVEEIRKWFLSKNYTVERYLEGEINDKILTNDFNATFPDKYNIEIITKSKSEKGQFQWYVERKTKSIKKIENSFNYNKFVTDITILIEKRKLLCNSKTMQNLSKYDFLVNKEKSSIIEYINNSIEKGYLKNVRPEFIENYGIKKLITFWNEHLKIKKSAMKLLSNYFKWTYNYNSSTFDEIFLKDFNLKPCKLCYDE